MNDGPSADDVERLARALHDDPLQVLIVAIMRLDMLSSELADEQRARLIEARDALRTACDHLRSIIDELQPPAP